MHAQTYCTCPLSSEQENDACPCTQIVQLLDEPEVKSACVGMMDNTRTVATTFPGSKPIAVAGAQDTVYGDAPAGDTVEAGSTVCG
jgi:hypothetical protein